MLSIITGGVMVVVELVQVVESSSLSSGSWVCARFLGRVRVWYLSLFCVMTSVHVGEWRRAEVVGVAVVSSC